MSENRKLKTLMEKPGTTFCKIPKPFVLARVYDPRPTTPILHYSNPPLPMTVRAIIFFLSPLTAVFHPETRQRLEEL